MVIVTGRNESNAPPMSSAFQLSRLSGVPLFGRSTDDFRKLSYGEKAEPVVARFRSMQHNLISCKFHYKMQLNQSFLNHNKHLTAVDELNTH